MKEEFLALGYNYNNLHQNYHLAFSEYLDKDSVFKTHSHQEVLINAYGEMCEYLNNYLKSQAFNFQSKIVFSAKVYANAEGFLDFLIFKIAEIPEIFPSDDEIEAFVAHVNKALKYFAFPVRGTKNFYFHTIIEVNK